RNVSVNLKPDSVAVFTPELSIRRLSPCSEVLIQQTTSIFNSMQGRLNMNFRPLDDRILIKRVEERETAKGGTIIPDPTNFGGAADQRAPVSVPFITN